MNINVYSEILQYSICNSKFISYSIFIIEILETLSVYPSFYIMITEVHGYLV
jgi:hypothetical protein